MSAGIGRQKERQLDDIVRRFQYLEHELTANRNELELSTRATLRDPAARGVICALLVLADSIRDLAIEIGWPS